MAAWKFILPISLVFHNEDLSLEEKAESIASTIEMKVRIWAPSFERPYHEDELMNIADEMRDAGKEDDVDWFDLCMSGLYDIADIERIWVKTF